MVIPMGSMGPPMFGPPPPEVQGRFKIMKYCVLGMLIAMATRIVTAFFLPMRVGQVILASVSMFLNVVIGIFLLKDDPLMGRMHRFLITTCCQSCEDSCGGGMSCLMSFIICNTITVVFDLLLNGIIQWVINAIGAVFDPSQWTSSLMGFILGVNVLSVIGSYACQIVGAVQGWYAYRQARDIGVTATPGEWSGGGGGGGPYVGGGFGGGGGGRAYPAAREDNAPAQGSQPARNFQPFGGSGQRLGDTN
mmetsp:Transcript_95176/g.296291  ORF Transcript_95176/g.296291 Transcript_95176/m.296291 type:complete len:249 (+) Transcript_95176:70-816(+)